MSTNYDAWLEQPYQDACKAEDEYFEACELFVNTDSYYEAYEEYIKDNPGVPIEDWELTNDYESSVTSFWEAYNEPPDGLDYSPERRADFPDSETW